MGIKIFFILLFILYIPLIIPILIFESSITIPIMLYSIIRLKMKGR